MIRYIIGIDAKEHPDVPNVWVTPAGNIYKRINRNHPERRQYMQYKLQVDKDGYLYVRLQGKKYLVHRLVYWLFVGELNPSMVICHMDGDPSNNQVSNLLQATQKDNIAHKRIHGTHQAGERHGRSIHTNAQVQQVKSAIKSAKRSLTGRLSHGEAKRISRDTGVSIQTVYAVSNKGAWACI